MFRNPEEISEILADTYYDISANYNYDKTFLTQKIKEENSLINFDPSPQTNAEPLYYNLPFSENEVLLTMKQASKNTSPGPDRIPNLLLQKLHPNSMTYLTSLSNRTFSARTFPSSWKLAVTVPILKPQKNPNHPSSYRPISALSTLSKILEKILNKRLS